MELKDYRSSQLLDELRSRLIPGCCFNCKHNGRGIRSGECKQGLPSNPDISECWKWEAKFKEMPGECKDCRFSCNNLGCEKGRRYSSDLRGCNEWEAKEPKSCCNCKYDAAPCFNHKDNYIRDDKGVIVCCDKWRPKEQKKEPIKPLPCPFCGMAPRVHEAWAVSQEGNTKIFKVECFNLRCPVHISTDGLSEEFAVQRWNTRNG